MTELIVACLEYAAPFILVVLVMITGFAYALFWRNQSLLDEEEESFLDSFKSIYMAAFGDFSFSTNEMSSIDIVLFYSATFLISLVMLNLFIGILSMKLEEVIENRAEKKNQYAELCGVISQMQSLKFWIRNEMARFEIIVFA